MSEEQFASKLEKIKAKNHQINLKNKLKIERNKYRRFNFSKMSTSNRVLIASITAVVSFTIACLYIQYKTLVEVSSTLMTLWYSFWTVEIVSLAGIKISKVFKEYKHKNDDCIDDSYEDEDEDEDFDVGIGIDLEAE